MLADDEGLLERLQQLLDDLREQSARRRSVAHVGARDARLQLIEQVDRRIGAGVCLQQRDLEVLVELLADLGADECARDRRAGALQAALQLGEPAGALAGALAFVARAPFVGGSSRRERRLFTRGWR